MNCEIIHVSPLQSEILAYVIWSDAIEDLPLGSLENLSMARKENFFKFKEAQNNAKVLCQECSKSVQPYRVIYIHSTSLYSD